MKLSKQILTVNKNNSNCGQSNTEKYSLKMSVLLASAILLIASCTKTGSDKPTNPAEPNNPPASNVGKTVTGVVLDIKGNPVAGASVRAENDVYNAWVEGTIDEKGKYTLSGIEFGGWKIYAWKDAEFDGKTYHLRMGMPKTEDYNPFAGDNSKAVVKNFVWQLSGVIPDRKHDDLNSYGYFGGSVNFVTLDIDFNALPDGTEVTVTCTPTPGAVLFDGSPAQAVVEKFTAHDTRPANYLYLIHDIAQSHYNLTATCKINGETKKVLMGWDIDKTTNETIDNFSFLPDGSSHGSYESGIQTQTDNPIYMRVEY